MNETRFFGFIARKQRWGLTGMGWASACLIVMAGLIWSIVNIYPFLAINAPIRGDILVVEGWLPDHALQQAAREFVGHDYHLLVTTGGPLKRGSFLTRYGTYARLAAATMARLGVDPAHIVAVPAPRVRKDRTYASALALRQWLETSELTVRSMDILTLGPHARRSRLVFEEALGPGIRVGVIAIADRSYESERWWRSSSGVRTVIDETIEAIAKL